MKEHMEAIRRLKQSSLWTRTVFSKSVREHNTITDSSQSTGVIEVIPLNPLESTQKASEKPIPMAQPSQYSIISPYH